MNRRPFRVAALGVLVSLLQPVWARAGSVGADLPESEVGDLRVSGAAVSKQTWTLQADGVELELALSETRAESVEGRLVLAAGPKGDFEDWTSLVAKYPKQAPKPAEFTADGKPLRVTQKIEQIADGDWMRQELVFTLPSAPAGQRVRIVWGTPRAGEDGIPLVDKAFVAHYCIDAGTAKALKKADGYVSQHLRLSNAAYEGKQGTVLVRVTKPSLDLAVSLCADGIQKLSKTVFELKLPANAPFLPTVRGGHRLSVLFGLRI